MEEFLKESLRGRPNIPGMAIDSNETIRPEDAFTVAEYGDGSFYVAVSFPEVGILDPQANTLKDMVRSLIDNPDKPPSCKIPSSRKQMHYGLGVEMPSLTVQGVFRPDRGITNANIIKSRVKPALYTYGDIDELRQNPNYIIAEKFAYTFEKYQSRANEPWVKVHSTPYKKYQAHPATITQQFMVFANTVTGDLSNQADLPQIYQTKEYHSKPRFDASPGFHEAVNTETYCGMSNPIRKLASWITHVSVSCYLDNNTDNGLPITREEIRMIAEWRNDQQRVKINGAVLIEATPA